STTHTSEPSRRGSAQIRQRSSSETLPQTAQNRTPSRTFASTAVNLSISGGSTDSRWNAMRWALLGPIPGNLPSSSIRSWTGPSNISVTRSDQPAGRPGRRRGWCRWSRGTAHPAGQRSEPLLRPLGDLLGGVPHGADDQVLQGLDVCGVYDLRVDLHRDHFTAAFDDDLDQAATGLTMDFRVRELVLGFHEFLLHLLRLSEQSRHVASGLHDNPLASWSRVGFACGCWAIRNTQRRPHDVTFAPWTYETAFVSASELLSACWLPPAQRLSRMPAPCPPTSPAWLCSSTRVTTGPTTHPCAARCPRVVVAPRTARRVEPRPTAVTRSTRSPAPPRCGCAPS